MPYPEFICNCTREYAERATRALIEGKPNSTILIAEPRSTSTESWVKLKIFGVVGLYRFNEVQPKSEHEPVVKLENSNG